MPLPEPAVLARFREERGLKVVEVARIYGVRAATITQLIATVERSCLREGCENPVTGSLASKYCGTLECRQERNRARERARIAAGPYGSKGTRCTSCGEPVWIGHGSRSDPVCQPCRRLAKGREVGLRAADQEFVCEQCHEPFAGRGTGPNRYCTKACDNESRREYRSCEQCNKLFQARHSAGSVTGRSRFCSYRCAGAWRTAQTPLKPPRPVYQRSCSECDGSFVTFHGSQLVCGPECRRVRESRKTSEGIMRRYYSDPVFRDQILTKAMNRRVSLLGKPGMTQPAHLIAYLDRKSVV